MEYKLLMNELQVNYKWIKFNYKWTMNGLQNHGWKSMWLNSIHHDHVQY
jgi:hypothetical protein